MNEAALLREMLRPEGTIAVVGLSERSDRPSHYVSRYMQEQGYRVLPVNPQAREVLGMPCVGTLRELQELPDVVNVFRLPAAVPAVVEEMVALGLKRLWVQQGIVNLLAAQRAEEAGIGVVMDRCIMVEHRRLFR